MPNQVELRGIQFMFKYMSLKLNGIVLSFLNPHFRIHLHEGSIYWQQILIHHNNHLYLSHNFRIHFSNNLRAKHLYCMALMVHCSRGQRELQLVEEKCSKLEKTQGKDIPANLNDLVLCLNEVFYLCLNEILFVRVTFWK
ncbi:hypothetical protein ACP275_08G217600 [Erythranthe tilingii]